MSKLTPQQIVSNKMNFDIENAAQNYKRPQNIQPVYANMNQSIQRQGSWE